MPLRATLLPSSVRSLGTLRDYVRPLTTAPAPRARKRGRKGLPERPAAAGRGFGSGSAVAEREAPAVEKLEWTPPLSIIRYPDPRLRAPNARVNKFDEDLRKFAADMFDAMYRGDDGVGLAAPQVGVNVRLMVFNETGQRGAKEEIVLVNPKVVGTNKQICVYEEGCLSFPKIFADVERPSQVKVKAQALDGSKFSMTLTGFPARIFQHEYDHLQGVLYHDRMKPKVFETIKRDLIRLEQDFQRRHPDTAIQTVSS